MKLFYFKSIYLLAILFVSLNLHAGKEKYNGRLSGTALIANASIGASDDKNPREKTTPVNSRYYVSNSVGKVIFGLNEFSTKVINSNYTASAKLKVYAYDKLNNLISGMPTTVLLDVNYNSGTTYKDKSNYIINGAHRVVVSVIELKINNVVNVNPNTVYDLFVETEVETERFYELDKSAGYKASYSSSVTSAFSSNNEAIIKWPIYTGAEEYELEYMHVNNYSGVTINGFLSASSINTSFKTGATRVRVKGNNYKISGVFESGYLIYRVRPISRSMQDLTNEEFGDWTFDNGNSNSFAVSSVPANHYILITSSNLKDHENNKNWLYSSTFAEDGKKKELITYYDGSNRNRQQLTKVNTDNNVIIGETFYDHQGRPAVDALPVPTKNFDNTIKYYENFNLSDNLPQSSSTPTVFSRLNFDINNTSSCPPTAIGMKTDEGASNYYSPLNTLNNQGSGAFIPNADKFPFTHKVYTPDNTGRIRTQSGVGSDYKMGSGHETKYVYGQPEQVEIDRLFGSEAGYYYRYKKNLVIDPNGQTSITYLNEEGKTVATSLAGDAPQAVNTLNTNSTSQLNQRYFKYTDTDYKLKNQEDGDSLVFTKVITPSTNGNYNFEYNVQVPVYSNTCTPNLCFNCVYDLIISIKDDCGNVVFNTNPVKVKIGTQSPATPNGGSCAQSYVFTPVVTPALNAISPYLFSGKTYIVKKVLSIDQNVLNTYVNRYTDTTYNTCIKKISQGFTEQSASYDPNDCNMTCASCSTNVYNYWLAHNNSANQNDPTYGYMSAEQRDILVSECMEKCNVVTPCFNNYQMMLADMSPSGQYAQYDKGTPYTASAYPLSVLNTANVLPLNAAQNANSSCNTLPILATNQIASWKFPNYYNIKKHGFIKPDKNTDALIQTSYANQQMPFYFNDDGTTAKIYLVTDPNNPTLYIPTVDPASISNIKTDATGKKYIYPNELQNLKDFINYFQPHWANSLVANHPEFSYFLECDKWGNTNYTTSFNSTNYTSDNFDALIASISSYAQAITLFPSLATQSINDIFNNDPYFNIYATNTSYVSTTHLTLDFIRSEFYSELTSNYSSSGKSLIDVSSLSSRCGNKFYQCTTCSATFGSNTSPNANVPAVYYQNKEWEFLKNAYLALKYKLQMKHSHYVNKNIKSTGNNLLVNSNNATTVYNIPMYNGCIGDPSFNYVSNGFYWIYKTTTPIVFGYDKTGFFTKCQTCNYEKFKLYSSKIKRFVDVDDNLNKMATNSNNLNDQIKAMKDKTEAEMFYLTGQCPITVHLGNFLNYLADNQLFTNSNPNPKPIDQIDGFTKELYETFYKCQYNYTPAVGSCYVPYNVGFSTSGNNLVISISNPSPPSWSSNITLIPISAINWAQVKYISNVAYLGSNNFSAIAHVQVSANPLTPLSQVNITINSPCITPSCNFPVSKCYPSQTSLDIQKVLNVMVGATVSSQTLIVSNASNLNTYMGNSPLPLSTLFPNLFLMPLYNSNAAPSDLNYSYSSGISTFYNSLNTSLFVNFAYTQVSGPPTIVLGDIDYFYGIEPHPSIPDAFYVNGHLKSPYVSGNLNTSIQKILVNVSYANLFMPKYILGTCSDPLPVSCETPKAKATLDMKNFLSELIPIAYNLSPNMYVGSINTNSLTYFTNNIASFMPGGTPLMINATGLSNNNKVFNFSISADQGQCTFTIEIPSTSTLDFLSSISINKVEASQETGELLIYVNSNNEIIKLKSSCMQFLNCERCQEEKTELYSQNLNSYNSSNLPGYVTQSYDQPQNASGSSSFVSIYNYSSSVPSLNSLSCSYANSSVGNVVGMYYPALSTSSLVLWNNTFSSPINISGGSFYFSFDYASCKSSEGSYQMIANGNTAVGTFTLSEGSWANTSQYLNLGSITSLNSIEIRFLGTLISVNNEATLNFYDNFKIYKKGCPSNTITLYPPQDENDDCEDQQYQFTLNNAYALFKKDVEAAEKKFRQDYKTKCKQSLEELKVAYSSQEHHFTLYYYDQAGNLIKTVPPEGIELINLLANDPVSNLPFGQAIENDRTNNTKTVFTSHRMATKYEYNSLNQLIKQYMPDHANNETLSATAKAGLPASFNAKSISFDPVNPNIGYAVGVNASNSNGMIYKTTDGGINWVAISTLSYGNIKGIAEKQNAAGDFLAVTDLGNLLLYTNSIWSNVTNLLPGFVAGTSLNDIAFSPSKPGHGFIVGDNGTIYYTANYGASFTSYTGPSVKLNKVIPGAESFIIVGNSGTVLYSNFVSTSFTQPTPASTQLNGNIHLTDGVLFTSVYSNNSSRLEAIVVGYESNTNLGYTMGKIVAIDNPNNSVNYLSGQNYNYALYTDPTPNSKLLAATCVINSSNLVQTIVAGTGGNIRLANYTPNTGAQGSGFPTTWNPFSVTWLNPNQVPDVTDVSQNNGNVVAALSNGNVLKNVLSASPIELANTAVNSSANVIFPGSATHPNQILGANNSNFTTISNILTSASFNLMSQFTCPQLNAVATRNGKVIACGNSGTLIDNFSSGNFALTTVTGNNYNGVAIDPSLNGLAVGNLVLTKFDANTPSSYVSAVSTKNYKPVVATSSNLFYSIDGSGNFDEINTSTGISVITKPPTPGAKNAMFAINTNTIYAAGASGSIAKLVLNNGVWTQPLNTFISGAPNINSVLFTNAVTGYAFADGNKVYKTIDGGVTWPISYTGPTGTDIKSAALNSSGEIVMVGNGNNLQTIQDKATDYNSIFLYDQLGRLVISQNAKQYAKTPKAYSFTNYDALGRIVKVGEVSNGVDPVSLSNQNGVITNLNYQNWLSGGAKTEVTSTFYDNSVSTIPSGFTPNNLRKRVSATYIDTDDNLNNGYTFATYYSYDIHGNVNVLMNDYPLMAQYGKQYNSVEYAYDLISGKVNKVTYQPKQKDQFIHEYVYDADNRITNVFTSRDGINWDQDAKYFYYKHGPLARTEIGNTKVQAIDYAYTLQGWIKGINSGALSENYDMGKDGKSGNAYIPTQADLHRYVSRDMMAYSLSYNNSDYSPINVSSSGFLPNVSSNNDLVIATNNLYNGNIRGMVTSIVDPVNNNNLLAQLNTYKYDQLNRLNWSRSYSDFNSVTNAFGSSPTYKYQNEFTYDANGNILTQIKKDQTNTSIDGLTYNYHKDANGKMVSNRLYHVNDAIASNVNTSDIDDQGTFTPANSNSSNLINSSNNYKYDQIGNLIADVQEKITDIKWNVYGKIQKITKFIPGANSLNTVVEIDFDYDPSGNRVKKSTTVTSTISPPPFMGISSTNNTNFYMRDAQGNVMVTYNHDNSNIIVGNPLVPTEFNVYGSSRVGMLTNNVTMGDINYTPLATTYTVGHQKGYRNYELSNHLGNVLTVVNDNRIPVGQVSNSSVVDYFKPQIVSTSDYYAFGQTMPGRQWVGTAGGYRYTGVNGQEKEDEIFAGASSAEYWMYDARLGRRWNLDPVPQISISDYACFANNPIYFADPLGDIVHVHGSWKERRAFWRLYRSNDVFRQLIDQQKTAQRKVTRTGKGKDGNDNSYYVDEHFHYWTTSNATPETDLITAAQNLTSEQVKRQKETDDDPKRTGNDNVYDADYTPDEEINYGNSFFKPIKKESDKKYSSVDITVSGGSNNDSGEDVISFYSGRKKLGEWKIPITGTGQDHYGMSLPSKTFHFDLPNPGKIRFEIRGGAKEGKKKENPGAGGGKVTIKKSTASF
jgi:photosystem II stability/assembly factor-like uncharacterized protein